MGRGGRAVEYVGGSSSVVAVGGRSSPGEGGNIALWDTLAPSSSAAVGRLGQHQVGELGASIPPRLAAHCPVLQGGCSRRLFKPLLLVQLSSCQC